MRSSTLISHVLWPLDSSSSALATLLTPSPVIGMFSFVLHYVLLNLPPVSGSLPWILSVHVSGSTFHRTSQAVAITQKPKLKSMEDLLFLDYTRQVRTSAMSPALRFLLSGSPQSRSRHERFGASYLYGSSEDCPRAILSYHHS